MAVRQLDAGGESWLAGPVLPSPRAVGAAAWDGERIVYGGGVGPDGLVGDVHVLEGDTWTRLGALSQAREHLAATSDGQGQVWLLGGRQGGLTTNLATLDLGAGSAVTAQGELPTPRGVVAAFW